MISAYGAIQEITKKSSYCWKAKNPKCFPPKYSNKRVRGNTMLVWHYVAKDVLIVTSYNKTKIMGNIVKRPFSKNVYLTSWGHHGRLWTKLFLPFLLRVVVQYLSNLNRDEHKYCSKPCKTCRWRSCMPHTSMWNIKILILNTVLLIRCTGVLNALHPILEDFIKFQPGN